MTGKLCVLNVKEVQPLSMPCIIKLFVELEKKDLRETNLIQVLLEACFI